MDTASVLISVFGVAAIALLVVLLLSVRRRKDGEADDAETVRRINEATAVQLRELQRDLAGRDESIRGTVSTALHLADGKIENLMARSYGELLRHEPRVVDGHAPVGAELVDGGGRLDRVGRHAVHEARGLLDERAHLLLLLRPFGVPAALDAAPVRAAAERPVGDGDGQQVLAAGLGGGGALARAFEEVDAVEAAGGQGVIGGGEERGGGEQQDGEGFLHGRASVRG